MQHYLGYLYILLAAVFWCILGPISRFVFSEGVAPLEAAFWRAFFGACCFTTHAIVTRQFKARPKDVAVFSLFGAIALGALYALYLVAVEQTGAALASVLLYTAPAWVAVLSFIFFREPLPAFKLVALVLAMFGAALASLSGGGLPGGASLMGIGVALFCGFLYSLHYIFSAHYLPKYSTINIFGWCMPVAAITIFPFVTFGEKTTQAWIYLLIMGVLSTYAATIAYCAALKRLPPTTVAVLANMEPIFTSLLAWWLLGELFSAQGWLGAALVCTALILIVLSRPQEKDSAATLAAE